MPSTRYVASVTVINEAELALTAREKLGGVNVKLALVAADAVGCERPTVSAVPALLETVVTMVPLAIPVPETAIPAATPITSGKLIVDAPIANVAVFITFVGNANETGPLTGQSIKHEVDRTHCPKRCKCAPSTSVVC